ncbi:MAG: HAD family hydrolase [Candidatus Gottesmanbacteria bacterium GW2011_GWC2_39_8]|uniref:HAD family hydrolase n=1 Tax=Candidatus Gottesmanbacteria bacterium GW2011_GWC2_39_8 TaxID=1618450 RepID=A0A0G0T8N3_9BACT|nr:MAG: HAD family hydrolase [Candidatus Gottesmanbacteria bacterium GW2011_GWC2_39_8]
MTGSDPQKMKTPKLVLFDIDGTLISARHPILSEAFFVTVENTFGVKDDRIYDYSKFEGATSRYICKAILEKHKVPVTEENIQKYFRAMYKYVVENMDESYGKGLFPEVIPFLTKLKENGIYRGVITGNGEDVGWHKLKVVGIDKYFDFGVFGDIPEKQDELAAQVGPKALNVLGFTFKPENI